MAEILIALGTNAGDRARNVSAALEGLRNHPQIENVRASGYYVSHPVGGPPGQDYFLNAAAVFTTSLAPEALLRVLQDLETQAGRARAEHWGPRTLDLDLLLYDDLQLETDELIVPHPRMIWRPFVLFPAFEVAAHWIEPRSGWTIDRLWRQICFRMETYIAVTGAFGEPRRRLAQEAAIAGRAAYWSGAARGARETQTGVETIEPEPLTLAAWGAFAPAERLGLARAWLAQVESLPGLYPRPTVVGDFWLDELLALAETTLPAGEREAFLGEIAPRVANAIAPTLCFGYWPRSALAANSEDSTAAARERGVERALRARLRSAAACPVAWLDRHTPREALEELQAAITAITGQPPLRVSDG